MLFDSGATLSFISYSCVEKLKLYVSSLNKDLVVETPTSGFMLTSNVCIFFNSFPHLCNDRFSSMVVLLTILPC